MLWIGLALAGVELEVVAEGLTEPAHLGFLGEGLVAASGSQLLLLKEGGPVSLVGCGPSCTVTSFAAAPDFAESGRLYVVSVDRSRPDPVLTLRAHTTDPEAEVGTVPLVAGEILFQTAAPSDHHLGGSVVVDESGAVYLALGDGSKAGDSGGHAQDPSTPWGAIHRFVPGMPPAANTVWATGVRDPWLLALPGGQLVVADTGRFTHELSLARQGSNLGWPLDEGGVCRKRPCPPSITAPFLTVGTKEAGAHWHLGAAPLAGPFAGRILFADSDHVRSMPIPSGRPDPVVPVRGFASAFATDPEGEVYVASRLTGKVYRLKQVSDADR